jgi:hypothetical protein
LGQRRTRTSLTKNGLRIKVLTSKAEPQIDGILALEILEEGEERTKGLKILKIKRDELFAVFNKSL